MFFDIFGSFTDANRFLSHKAFGVFADIGRRPSALQFCESALERTMRTWADWQVDQLRRLFNSRVFPNLDWEQK